MQTKKKIAIYVSVLLGIIVLFSLLILPLPFIIHFSISIVVLISVILLVTFVFFRNLFLPVRYSKTKNRLKVDKIRQMLLLKISSTYKIRPMLYSIVAVLSSNLKLPEASIYLLDPDSDYYVLKESVKAKDRVLKKRIAVSNALVEYLKINKSIIYSYKKNLDPKIVECMDSYHAMYCLPMFYDGSLISILFLGPSSSENMLSDSELKFLSSLPNIVAKPIYNAQNHYDIHKRMGELSSLYEVGKVISSSFELDKTINVIATNASIVLRAPKIIISLRENLTRPFEIKKVMGFSKEQVDYLYSIPEENNELTMKLVEAKTPLLFENVKNNSIYDEHYQDRLAIYSAISVPLFDSELNVIGELRAMRDASQKVFTTRELDLGAKLANNVTIAIKNASLFSELRAVYKIGNKLNSTQDFLKLQDKIVSTVRKEFSFERVLLFVFDPKNDHLIASQGIGFDEKVYRDIDIHIHKCVLGRSIVEKRVIAVEDARKDPRVSHELVSFLGLRSFISIPLITQGKIVGALLADYNEQPVILEQINMTLLNNIANLSSMALNNSMLVYKSAKLNTILRKEQGKTRKELAIARSIQQGLLSTTIPSIAGISIATQNIPCRAVGGDFFNFISSHEGKLGFVIGDVSGKGIPAALIMTMANGIFSEVASNIVSPKQVLVRANDSLRAGLADVPMFYATAFYGVFDLNENVFTYCKAGHNPPVFYQKESTKATFLDTEGTYLGAFEDCGFIEKKLLLNSGDKIIFYTDGATEAKSPSREMFGKDRLIELVSRYGDLSAEELKEKIINTLKDFMKGNEFDDDLILVICEMNYDAGSADKVKMYQFEMSSTLENTKTLVKEILDVVGPAFSSKEHLFHLRLAISEALRNAVEHGNMNDPTKTVKVLCELDRSKVKLMISDEGVGFDPEKQDIPENRGESGGRGRGMMAINACMDEVMYNETGNTITLIKYS